MPTREGGRLSQLERTAKLISTLLRGRELSRSEVACLLGVGLAAADRHLGAIQLHLPLVRSRHRGQVRWRLDRSKVLASTKLPSLGTVIAACLGGSLSRLFERTSYESGMTAVVQYLVDQAKGADAFRNARRQFVFVAGGGEVALPESAGILDDLLGAILGGKYVRIRYVGFEGIPRYEQVQPLSFAVYEHQLYLLGTGASGRPKPYRFSRIRSVSVLPKEFAYPDKEAYEPETLFADSLGVFVDPKYDVERIELSLHSRWTHFVKTHRWHRSQQSWREGERLHLALKVRVCPEVVAWVLSFGPDAVVLSPPTLRAKIAALSRTLADQYSARDSP